MALFRVRVLLLLPVFTLLLPRADTRAGEKQTERLENLMKSEETQKVKDIQAFRDLAQQCLEKKIGPAVLQILEVLEALDPKNKKWAEFRTQAESLPPPASSFRSWGKGQIARRKREAAKAWSILWKEAGKQGFRHAARRIAECLLLFDPNDKKARKALGHVKFKGTWMTRFDADKAKLGIFHDPKWGYVSEEAKQNLEAGKRPVGDVWLPKAEEVKTTRPWRKRVVIDDPTFIVMSDYPYDACLAVHKQLKAFLKEMDRTFGDLFRPADQKWPLTLKVCQTKKALAEVVSGNARAEQMMAHLFAFPSEDGDVIYCRGDGFPKGTPEAYLGVDFLKCELLDWYYMFSSGGEMPRKSANPWITWGMAALARSRGAFVEGKLPHFGCLKHYLQGKQKNLLPLLSNLCQIPEG
ncbi:MAG: hypothetical protein ACYTHM_13615 [Planctomycetota bacterium]|jgi:hypothetical protein